MSTTWGSCNGPHERRLHARGGNVVNGAWEEANAQTAVTILLHGQFLRGRLERGRPAHHSHKPARAWARGASSSSLAMRCAAALALHVSLPKAAALALRAPFERRELAALKTAGLPAHPAAIAPAVSSCALRIAAIRCPLSPRPGSCPPAPARVHRPPRLLLLGRARSDRLHLLALGLALICAFFSSRPFLHLPARSAYP